MAKHTTAIKSGIGQYVATVATQTLTLTITQTNTNSNSNKFEENQQHEQHATLLFNYKLTKLNETKRQTTRNREKRREEKTDNKKRGVFL